MKVERHITDVEVVFASTVELISRARQRTSEELDSLSADRLASHAVAIPGDIPYVTLPNGMTVVMRKCGAWGC